MAALEPLRPRDPADPFVRQRPVDGWNQALLERKSALVLGVGGLGSTVAMCLCRMGVRHIDLLDMDTVDHR